METNNHRTNERVNCSLPHVLYVLVAGAWFLVVIAVSTESYLTPVVREILIGSAVVLDAAGLLLGWIRRHQAAAVFPLILAVVLLACLLFMYLTN